MGLQIWYKKSLKAHKCNLLNLLNLVCYLYYFGNVYSPCPTTKPKKIKKIGWPLFIFHETLSNPYSHGSDAFNLIDRANYKNYIIDNFWRSNPHLIFYG